MKRAIYDNYPASIEAVGNGCILYRWDIQEETVETQEGGTRVQYSCLEVGVYEPVDYSKLVSAMVRLKYPSDDVEAIILNYGDGDPEHEQKYTELQEWRVQVKSVARQLLNNQ